jgi:ssDNA-binding Zn-finger/Zn-ribbon topoisomerase 1
LVKAKIGIVVGPTEVEVLRCPVCHSGILTRSPRDDGTHCSNYPPCEFQSPWCPKCNQKLHVTSTNPMKYECTNHPDEAFSTCTAANCGWGILVERQGRYGSFQACTNYMAIGCRGR